MGKSTLSIHQSDEEKDEGKNEGYKIKSLLIVIIQRICQKDIVRKKKER